MTTHDAPAYAIAYLREVEVNDDILEYLRRIGDTLTPFDGTFLVHGGELTPIEGEWDGDVIIIRFPNATAATDWYHSPAYAEILPLRTENSSGIVALVEGVAEGYRPEAKVAQLT